MALTVLRGEVKYESGACGGECIAVWSGLQGMLVGGWDWRRGRLEIMIRCSRGLIITAPWIGNARIIRKKALDTLGVSHFQLPFHAFFFPSGSRPSLRIDALLGSPLPRTGLLLEGIGTPNGSDNSICAPQDLLCLLFCSQSDTFRFDSLSLFCASEQPDAHTLLHTSRPCPSLSFSHRP